MRSKIDSSRRKRTYYGQIGEDGTAIWLKTKLQALKAWKALNEEKIQKSGAESA